MATIPLYIALPERLADVVPVEPASMIAAVVLWITYRYPTDLPLVAGTRKLDRSIAPLVAASFLLGTAWYAVERVPFLLLDLAAGAPADLSNYSRTWLRVLNGSVLVEVDIVLLTPFAEEMLFRGVLFQALLRRWRFWPAAFISSLVFTVSHFDLTGLMLVLRLVGDVPAGIGMAILFHRSRTLAAPIAFHAGLNAGLPIF